MPGGPAIFADDALARVELARQAAEDEQRKLRRRFGEDVGGVGEGDLEAVGVGSVDVVKPDGVLSDDSQPATPGFEHLGVNRIAQRGEEAVDAGADFLDDHALGRRLGARVDFDFVAAPAQELEGVLPDVAGGEDPKTWFGVGHRRRTTSADSGPRRVDGGKPARGLPLTVQPFFSSNSRFAREPSGYSPPS